MWRMGVGVGMVDPYNTYVETAAESRPAFPIACAYICNIRVNNSFHRRRMGLMDYLKVKTARLGLINSAAAAQ